VVEELDTLEELGWLEINGPQPSLTEKGSYALRRFLAKCYKVYQVGKIIHVVPRKQVTHGQ